MISSSLPSPTQMYEPMQIMRSLEELQNKFQPPFGLPSVPVEGRGGRTCEHSGSCDRDLKPPAFLAEENQAKIIDYRGEKVAAFEVNGVEMICLPQVFDMFLKNLVGGLHTIYTKLKRLDIIPLVCNVEQVRALRGLGAIQPGVNRCKLIARSDFDSLYDDCAASLNRPGRPPKRSAEEWMGMKRERSLSEMASPPSSFSIDPSQLLSSSSTHSFIAPSFLSSSTSAPPLHTSLLQQFLPQILMQQMLAAAKMGWDEAPPPYREWFRQSTVEEEKEVEDSPLVVEAKEEREEESPEDSGDDSRKWSESGSGGEGKEGRLLLPPPPSRTHSESRDDSKSMSPNQRSQSSNGNSTTQEGSPSRPISASDYSRLTGLLEAAVEKLKQSDQLKEEREKRETAERLLEVERTKTRLYFRRYTKAMLQLIKLRETRKVPS